MIKAEQSTLLQKANIRVVNIRNLEMTYYMNTYNNLSIQSGLVAGFVLQVLTNLNLSQAQKNAFTSIASAIFWILSALVVSSSLHCCLTSMLCNVYAPGLALRGPAGSMVKAVDGMIEEQTVILSNSYYD